MMERQARILYESKSRQNIDIKTVISPGTLVIAISQSGETADTVAAVRGT